MADLDATYSAFAAARGLEPLPALALGPLTPLLVESQAAARLRRPPRGRLGGEVDGVVGQLAYTRNKTFRFNVALAEVPASTAFAPRALLHPPRPQHPRRRVLRLRGAPLEALDREHGAERALQGQHQPLPGPELAAAAVLAGASSTGWRASRRPTSPSSSPTAPCSAASRTTIPAPTASRRSARRPPTSPRGSRGSARSSDAAQPHRHLPDRLLRPRSAWRCAIVPSLPAPPAEAVADPRLDRGDLGPRRRRPRLVRAPRQERKAAHQDWIFRKGSRGTATVLDAGSRRRPSTRCR